ncbi:MAG: transporter [Burkholderiales bacterium]|nr:transporter [Burkholderiales bacterium]
MTRNSYRPALGTIVLFLLYPAISHAIDTEPGAYTALPHGVDALGMYFQNAHRKERYSNGAALAGRQELNSTTVQAIYRSYRPLGSLTAGPVVIASCGRQAAGGAIAALGEATGCIDPIFGVTVWAINAPAQKNYFGISPYVVAPIGHYDKNKGLNMGENRWKVGVNSGYITSLSERFLLDVVGDIVWHGKNDEYGVSARTLEQKPIYNAQIHLRYQIDSTSRVSMSYLHDWGGENSINGVEQRDRKNQGRIRIGGAKFFDANNQLQVELGRDTKIANGFKEDNRLILRYVRIWR